MKNLILLFVLLVAFTSNAQDPLVSQGKPIYANSEYDQSGTYAADQANDGDVSTRWASVGYYSPFWIYVDLEETYDISSVSINWQGACGEDYTIEVSDDQINWTVAKTIVGNTTYDQEIVEAISATGRYVRVNTTKAPYNMTSIWEFKIYGTKSATQPDPVTNIISLNKPVTAISEFDARYEATYVNDGIIATRWASESIGDSLTKWIYIDLEASYLIDSVHIFWDGAYGKDYTIDVSDNTINWTAVETVVGDSVFGQQTFPDMSASGRYVRINATKSSMGHISVNEFTVFGSISTAIISNKIESSAGIEVFPNPTTDFFSVNVKDDSEAQLSVYELTGRLVYSDRFVKTKVVHARELGTSGILIIKVDTENNTYSKKLIVK